MPNVALNVAPNVPTQAATAETPGADLAVPEPLARRVAQLLAEAGGGARPIEQHLAAAEHTVARLLRDQSTSRASALDLLAADALATSAFELAADDPEAIPGLAAQAMARFAALSTDAARGAAGFAPSPDSSSVPRAL